MIWVIYVHVDTVFEFYCSVGCFSMIVWTSAALSVLNACVLYFLYLPLFIATEHVSSGKAL